MRAAQHEEQRLKAQLEADRARLEREELEKREAATREENRRLREEAERNQGGCSIL
jgi:hypothetical protein